MNRTAENLQQNKLTCEIYFDEKEIKELSENFLNQISDKRVKLPVYYINFFEKITRNRNQLLVTIKIQLD